LRPGSPAPPPPKDAGKPHQGPPDRSYEEGQGGGKSSVLYQKVLQWGHDLSIVETAIKILEREISTGYIEFEGYLKCNWLIANLH